jgi:hypothetical protein
MKKYLVLMVVVYLCILVSSSSAQKNLTQTSFLQVTAFTFQGNLKDGSGPANGTYDFEFVLFDAATAGNQVGATVPKSGVIVSNGTFSVILDFGNQFPDVARYIEVHVRTTGGGSFTVLGPRQQVLTTPYSMRSISASNADSLGGTVASNFVLTSDTRLSDARNPLAGSSNYIQNTTSQQAASFNISGDGTILNTLTANAVNAITQYNINFGRVLGVGSQNTYVGLQTGPNNAGDDNTYVGYQAGVQSQSGTNSFFGAVAGQDNTTGGANTFFGFAAGHTNLTGNSNTIIGSGADVGSTNLSNATAIGALAVVTASDTIQLGKTSTPPTVQIPGTVVLGTLGSAGATALCRNGSNQIATCSSSLRYKTNVVPFTGGLSILNRLHPITFDWKQGGMHDLGFGAEDVAKIEPLLTTRNDKGEVEGVKYDRISAVLVNAVKEQQSEIEALRQMVNSQRSEIAILQKEIHSRSHPRGSHRTRR